MPLNLLYSESVGARMFNLYVQTAKHIHISVTCIVTPLFLAVGMVQLERQ